LGINAKHISPYNLQSNLVERVTSRIGNMLQIKLVGQTHNQWFEYKYIRY